MDQPLLGMSAESFTPTQLTWGVIYPTLPWCKCLPMGEGKQEVQPWPTHLCQWSRETSTSGGSIWPQTFNNEHPAPPENGGLKYQKV